MIDRDNSLLPLCHQGTKKWKEVKEVKMPRRLLVVLHLLIVIGLLFIIIVVIRSTCKADAKSYQLSRSRRGIGVRDGWEDRHVGELKEWLISLSTGVVFEQSTVR
jgi:hypothetical protein